MTLDSELLIFLLQVGDIFVDGALTRFADHHLGLVLIDAEEGCPTSF